MYILYCRSPTHLGDENILRLDIPMKAVVLVAEVHSLKYFIHFRFYCTFYSSPVMRLVNTNYIDVHCLKVHKHEIFFVTFFAETESLWSQGPVT